MCGSEYDYKRGPHTGELKRARRGPRLLVQRACVTYCRTVYICVLVCPYAYHIRNDRGDAALPTSPVQVLCERAGQEAIKGDKGPLGKMWCQCNVESEEMIADETGCTAGDRAELCRWDKSASFCTAQD